MSDKLLEIKERFTINVQIAYGFIDEGFQTIDFNESEAKDYFKEFKSSLDYYNTHIDEFESSGPRGEVARSYLEKFDIVLRMFKGTKTQADFALKMLHVFIIALYEGFNKEFFSELFMIKPDLMIKNLKKKKLTISSPPSSLLEVATEKVNKFRKNIDWLAGYLKGKSYNIDLTTDFKEWKDFRENYYRRNVIVHNNGIIDDDYCDKISLSKTEAGKPLVMGKKYLLECNKNTIAYFEFLYEEITNKLGLSKGKKKALDFNEIYNKLKQYHNKLK